MTVLKNEGEKCEMEANREKGMKMKEPGPWASKDSLKIISCQHFFSFIHFRSSSPLCQQMIFYFFLLLSFTFNTCVFWNLLYLMRSSLIGKRKWKNSPTQPKPAKHWTQQTEKRWKSIRHFSSSPSRKDDWGAAGVLTCKSNQIIEGKKSSASNSIIRQSLLQTLRAYQR